MYVTEGVSNQPETPLTQRKDMLWVRNYVEQQVAKRAIEVTKPIIDFMRSIGVYEFILAGGALYKGPVNDLDIWPDKWNVQPYLKYVNKQKKPNKTYLEMDFAGTKVQFCTEPAGISLEDLVNSFDFAHCKAGATISMVQNDPELPVTALGYVHPDFIAAMATQSTFYSVGHKWPLNSLARVGKVALKLGLSTDEAKDLATQIVNDIAKRGIGSCESGGSGYPLSVPNSTPSELSLLIPPLTD